MVVLAGANCRRFLMVAWREKIGDEIETDIALMGEDAYVVAVTKSGNVSICEAATGKEYAHFTVEEGDSTPIYADGVLYITTPSTITAYAGFGR